MECDSQEQANHLQTKIRAIELVSHRPLRSGAGNREAYYQHDSKLSKLSAEIGAAVPKKDASADIGPRK
jgi:hypothetical protein